MTASTALELAIRTWTARLEHDHDRILRAAVVVEQPHLHHRRGNEFCVRVNVVVPGRDVAVAATHTDPYVALGDAFRSARRQLREFVTARRERVRVA